MAKKCNCHDCKLCHITYRFDDSIEYYCSIKDMDVTSNVLRGVKKSCSYFKLLGAKKKENLVDMTLDLDDETFERVQQAADLQGVTPETFVKQALEHWYQQEKLSEKIDNELEEMPDVEAQEMLDNFMSGLEPSVVSSNKIPTDIASGQLVKSDDVCYLRLGSEIFDWKTKELYLACANEETAKIIMNGLFSGPYKIPNFDTIKAMLETERGEGLSEGSIDELLGSVSGEIEDEDPCDVCKDKTKCGKCYLNSF